MFAATMFYSTCTLLLSAFNTKGDAVSFSQRNIDSNNLACQHILQQ